MAGELSHWPARDTSMMFCHQELPQTKLDRLSEWVDSDGVRVAAGHFSFTNQVTFTSQQLDHFGCKSNKRLTDMHKSGIMVCYCPTVLFLSCSVKHFMMQRLSHS